MIPTINKPTRVMLKTTTAVDHVLTNCFTVTAFKSDIGSQNPDEGYTSFFNKFSDLHSTYFLKKEIKFKVKIPPWITKMSMGNKWY